MIGEDYGNAYVPDAPRQYQTKAKNAQEAHEAIRPTDLSRRPAEMRGRLDTDQARLYELIWKRTIASQMELAELERTTVDIAAKAGSRVLELRATGQVIKFDGFLALYQEGRDDEEDEDSRRLPAMSARRAAEAADRLPSPSTSPSRRRASPRRRWSSAWKSSASAVPRPMPRSCRC